MFVNLEENYGRGGDEIGEGLGMSGYGGYYGDGWGCGEGWGDGDGCGCGERGSTNGWGHSEGDGEIDGGGPSFGCISGYGDWEEDSSCY